MSQPSDHPDDESALSGDVDFHLMEGEDEDVSDDGDVEVDLDDEDDEHEHDAPSEPGANTARRQTAPRRINGNVSLDSSDDDDEHDHDHDEEDDSASGIGSGAGGDDGESSSAPGSYSRFIAQMQAEQRASYRRFADASGAAAAAASSSSLSAVEAMAAARHMMEREAGEGYSTFLDLVPPPPPPPPSSSQAAREGSSSSSSSRGLPPSLSGLLSRTTSSFPDPFNFSPSELAMFGAPPSSSPPAASATGAARGGASMRGRRRRMPHGSSFMDDDLSPDSGGEDPDLEMVRVKTEPMEESSSSSMARGLHTPVPAAFHGASSSEVPLSPTTSSTGAAAAAAAPILPGSNALLSNPEAYLVSQQQQLLANIPGVILYLFGIVEQKLKQLKQPTPAEPTAAPKPAPSASPKLSSSSPVPGASASASASTAASTTAASSSAAKPTPGVLAEQRELVARIKEIQRVVEVSALSKSAAAATTGSSSTSSSASSAASKSSSEAAITNEEQAYRAVLIQALVSILAVCAKAKTLDPASASSSGAAASSSFPRWFPAERASTWKLLISESLLFLESAVTAASATAATSPSSGSSQQGQSTEMISQLKSILSFLCGGSEAEANLLRDTIVYEAEFCAILALFGVGPSPDEVGTSVDATSKQISSASFTHFDEATAERLCSAVMSQRAFSYPKRVSLLESMRRLNNLAQRRPATFLAFVLRKSVASVLAAATGADKKKASAAAAEQAKSAASAPKTYSPTSPTMEDSPPPASATAAAADATGAAPSASASESAGAQAPRSKLVYLLYLLSVFLSVDDADPELAVVMSLLGIVAQFVPQADEAYVAQVQAIAASAAAAAAAAEVAKLQASRSSSPPALSPLQRHASTPPPAAPSAAASAALANAPLFRSSSGTTVMSLLHARSAHLSAIGEEKKADADESMPPLEASTAVAPVAAAEPQAPPTLLSAVFNCMLERRPELLVGFVQRHLLENGSAAVRAHARALLFLMWRSLSTVAMRRRFFNRVLAPFISGGHAGHGASAITTATSASVSSSSTLAFYGSQAREYLTLVHTIILDSKHAHTKTKAVPAPAAASAAKAADEPTDMELDSSSSAMSATPRRDIASAVIATTAALVESGGVAGLTPADCSSVVRRLLDVMWAQSVSFQSHSLLPSYSKLSACFDLAPSQHYLQSCACSICNGRAISAPAEPTGSTGAEDDAGPQGSLARHRAYLSSLSRGIDDSASSGGANISNLRDLAVESKYSHCTRAVRLVSLQTIHSLHLKISGVPALPASSGSSGAPQSSVPGSSSSSRHRVSLAADGSSMAGTSMKHVKRIDIYFSDRLGVELAALPLPTYIVRAPASGAPASQLSTEGNEHWTLARSVEVPSTSSREVRISFPIGLHASALLIHFASFYENFDSLGEPIMCPRCHVPVASRTSQCSRCRESVGQCVRCRAIDYEHTDAFQCSECAHSRYGTFNFLLQSKPSSHVTRITNEAGRKSCMVRIAAIQERITALLKGDMDAAQRKLDRAWNSGGSRVLLDAIAPVSSSSKSAKSKPRESRLDFAHLPSGSSLVAPSTSALMRTVYEMELSLVHQKLSTLYRELLAHRRELFLYLNKSEFYLTGNGAACISTSDEPLPLVSDPATLATTGCYSCAKHFLLLSVATLYEMDVDCLLGAHTLALPSRGPARVPQDLALIEYFLSHSTSPASGGPRNPFALEASFLAHSATKLLSMLVRADDERGGAGAAMEWMRSSLEPKIIKALSAGQDASATLLSSLLQPLLSLCTHDLASVRKSSASALRSFSIRGMSARFQMLFRVLLAAVYSQGAQSLSVSSAVIAPILALLVDATKQPAEKPRDKNKKVASSSKPTQRTTKTATSSASALDAQRQALEALSRQLNADPSSMMDLEDRELMRELGRSLRSEAVPLLPILSQRMPSQAGSASGSAAAASSSPGQLPAILPPATRRVSSTSGGASGAPGSSSPGIASGAAAAAPARRSNFQRSPGMHPSVSPGSSRLGKAGRVPVPGSAPAAAQSAASSSSSLPPLSLASSEAVQLTLQSLANDMLGEVAALWPGHASTINLSSWLSSNASTSASTVALFDRWLRSKAERALRGATSAAAAAACSPTPSPSPPPSKASNQGQLNAELTSALDAAIASLPASTTGPFRVSQSDDCGDLTSIYSRLSAAGYKSRDEMLLDVTMIVNFVEALLPDRLPLVLELQKAIRREVEALDKKSSTTETSAGASAAKPESGKAATCAAASMDVDSSSLSATVLSATDRSLRLHASFYRLRSLSKSPSAHAPAFFLSSLLLCPWSLSVRDSFAQLVWNLCYPALSAQQVNTLVFKPSKKRKSAKSKAKNNNAEAAAASSSAQVASPAVNQPAESADAVEVRTHAFLSAMLSILRTLPAAAGLYSKPFFNLFTHLLHPPVRSTSAASDSSKTKRGGGNAALKYALVVKGILPLLIQRFHAELSSLEAEESSMDFVSSIHALSSVSSSSVGQTAEVHKHHALFGISMLLSCLLDEPRVLAFFKRTRMPGQEGSSRTQLLGEQTLSLLLRLRGCMLVHSKWLDRASAYLGHIVSRLFSITGSVAEKKATLQAYVFALSSGNEAPTNGSAAASSSSSPSSRATLNPHISLHILDQLASLIKPPKLEQQCLITFKKSASQEEYIRGNMKRGSHLSSGFLPTAAAVSGAPAASGAASSAPAASGSGGVVLFRHLKDAICTQLKLPNEENMIELLVGGKIVSMDVPVLRMYTKWFSEQPGGGSSGAGTTYARTASGALVVSQSPGLGPRSSPNSDGEGDDDDSGEADEEFGGSGDLLSGGEGSGSQPQSVLLAGDLPMMVTYRLTGLDGEATEEKIDSLPDPETVQEDPEVEYALAGALGEAGLRLLLQRLDAAMDQGALHEDVDVKLVSLLLKLLQYAVKIRANRVLLLQLQPPAGERANAVPFAFRVLLSALVLTLRASSSSAQANESKPASASSSSSAAAAPAASAPSPSLTLGRELLQVLNALLMEFAAHGQADLPRIESLEKAPAWKVPSEQLHALLSCLSLPSVRASSDLYHGLLALVPLLSFGQAPLLAAVEAHFAPHLDLYAYDLYHTPLGEASLEAFAILAEEIPRGTLATDAKNATGSSSSSAPATLTPSPIGAAVRDHFVASGLVQRLFMYLQQAGPANSSDAAKSGAASSSGDGDASMASATSAAASTVGKGAKKRGRDGDDAVELTQLVARPALPFVLRMLTGLVYGHAPSQTLAQQLSVLRVLQQLEGMASTSRVGPLAESLLHALMLNNEAASSAVADLRGHKKVEKKRKALDQRAKMLAQMGFASAGGAAGGKASKAAAAAQQQKAAMAHFSGLETLDESEHILKCSVCLGQSSLGALGALLSCVRSPFALTPSCLMFVFVCCAYRGLRRRQAELASGLLRLQLPAGSAHSWGGSWRWWRG